MVFILYMLRQAPSGGHDLHSSNGLCLILHIAALVISAILDVVMVAIIIDSLGPNGSYIMSTFFSHNDTLIHIVGLLLVRILAVTAALILMMIVCCCASPEKIDLDAR